MFRGDDDDLQKVGDYAQDIFERLFDDEEIHMPRADYMDCQPEVDGRKRGVLVDWLIEVHMGRQMRPETLYLAVNIVDRYLSVRQVATRHLQLLGVVGIFIASKFEEIDPPKAHELAYLTDNSYTKAEIVQMECAVLSALEFEIVVPTQAHFIERLQRVNGCSERHRALAEYLLELALLQVEMIQYSPSLLVSSALLLSNELLGERPAWPPAMAYHARRPQAALQRCKEHMRGVMVASITSELQAVHRKYQLDKFHAVANLSVVSTAL